ncbi:RtcB family protein [Rathayibacter rathayi]|uniref:RtcB family protein n=1 Tax=Rathayibacter rathayi TaxID=33887 RepID=UPI003B969729
MGRTPFGRRANRRIVATAEPRVAELEALAAEAGFDPDRYAQHWRLQLGTLGSGNHFIDVSVDETDAVWLFLRSGSRGVGNRIASAHIRIARDYCARHWITLPDPDLAYLVEKTAEFDRYIAELRWAQPFALLNREETMDRVVRQLSAWLGRAVERGRADQLSPQLHNFTEKERHLGREVWVSRKGVIQADAGRPGGTCSR